MSKDVYIVHCVDTEGPLYESLEATFSRLKEIFGVDLEPTRKNLNKIQNREIDLNGKEDLVADAFADNRISTLGSWTEVDKVLDDLMSESFRNKVVDSENNGWVFNWFCLDHVGFTGNNPRRRDAGFGNIYEHYLTKIKENHCEKKDLLQFLYHPLPFNGHYNYCGTSYINSNNLFEIMCRRLIDKQAFPASYRAGMEAERPDAHWFLEQWIPFDYSNDSYERENSSRQPDLRDGRYGDWRHASMKWRPYHPSHDDYQEEGYCHRWITRCISLDSRVAKLETQDVKEAFEQADRGETAILSFANHDFRDMHKEVENAMYMIKSTADKYPDVKYHFVDAIEAMKKTEGLEAAAPEFNVKLAKDQDNDACELVVMARNSIFGTQPFLAIKTITGQYFWDNWDYGLQKGKWTYVFDDKTLHFNTIDTIAFASNNDEGKTEIIIVKVREGKGLRLYKHGQRILQKQEFNL